MEILDVNDSSITLDGVSPTVIKVIGCGGCGGNAVNTMIEAGIKGVNFIALNTDLQQLTASKAETKIQIGKKITNGLGAGMHPEIGEAAAREEEEKIRETLEDSDMVFITAGMGGGTGTGSAPIVAKIAKELEILTVAVVTTPFDFEGPVRMELAKTGIKRLRDEVDSLIVIPNQKVFEDSEKGLSAVAAFKVIDDILRQGVQGISDIITKTGLVNRDFEDVKSVMKGQGDAILGIGEGEGENRAVDAATNAINNKLLSETHIDGAKNILIGIFGNDKVGIEECQEIAKLITASADKNVRVLWGFYIDNEMQDKISVTVIATGFNKTETSVYEETSVEEEIPVKNENVYSADDFIRVLNPSKNKIRQEKSDVQSAGLFDEEDLSQKVVPEREMLKTEAETPVRKPIFQNSPETAKRSHGIVPPPNFKDDGDIEKPACWRKKEGLSRTINLTDK